MVGLSFQDQTSNEYYFTLPPPSLGITVARLVGEKILTSVLSPSLSSILPCDGDHLSKYCKALWETGHLGT